jgi:hypothetical protein
MRLPVTVEESRAPVQIVVPGIYVATLEVPVKAAGMNPGDHLGRVSARGATREEALARLREGLRLRGLIRDEDTLEVRTGAGAPASSE